MSNNRHYFNCKKEAEKFIKKNNILEYHYEVPEEYNVGVDLVIDEFVCEICKQKTPLSCEGSEPNTCAMCMPLPDNEFMGEN